MTKFSQYMTAQEVSRTAFANYNYAGSQLDNARIKERLAEIRSQHEPINTLSKTISCDVSAREAFDALCTYVVHGNKEKLKARMIGK